MQTITTPYMVFIAQHIIGKRYDFATRYFTADYFMTFLYKRIGTAEALFKYVDITANVLVAFAK